MRLFVARLSELSSVFPLVRIVTTQKEDVAYTGAVIALSQRPNPLCTAFRLRLPFDRGLPPAPGTPHGL